MAKETGKGKKITAIAFNHEPHVLFWGKKRKKSFQVRGGKEEKKFAYNDRYGAFWVSPTLREKGK